MSVDLTEYVLTNLNNTEDWRVHDDTITVLTLADYYSALYNNVPSHEEDIEHRDKMLLAIEFVISDFTTEDQFKQIIKLAKEEN